MPARSTRSTRSASKRGPAPTSLSNLKEEAEAKHVKASLEMKVEPRDEFEGSEEDSEAEAPEVPEAPRPPVPAAAPVVVDDTKYAKVNNRDKATDGKCGHCEGCVRSPCQVCSACKRQQFGECIDLYCTNERSGITERVNLREMYLQTLKVQREVQVKSSGDETSTSDEESGGEDDRDRETGGDADAPSVDTKAAESQQKKQKNFNATVYGGSSRALKSRRCGECEGCTKDDCGTCAACLDKPRFGGKGTKKKACAGRYCRLKTLYKA